MLVAVVTVFIICQLPGLGIRVAYTVSEFAKNTTWSSAVRLDVTTLRYANVASNALLVFNSAVNIVVYCLVGKRFRSILLNEMLNCGTCCRCCASASAKSPRGTTRVSVVCDSRL